VEVCLRGTKRQNTGVQVPGRAALFNGTGSTISGGGNTIYRYMVAARPTRLQSPLDGAAHEQRLGGGSGTIGSRDADCGRWFDWATGWCHGKSCGPRSVWLFVSGAANLVLSWYLP
jgi:hypothetical protein